MKLKVITIILCLCGIAYSLDMPYILYDRNGQLSKLSLINTIQDIYVRLGNTVNIYGSQVINGTKTFTQPIVAQSSMTVYGTIGFGDGTTQNTAFKPLSSAYWKSSAAMGWAAGAYTTLVGSTITITTNGGTKLTWAFTSSGYNTTSGSNNIMTVRINNVDQGGTYGCCNVQVNDTTGSIYTYASIGMTDILSAGTYNLYLQAKCSSGSFNLIGDITPVRFNVQEIK
jgi:hypothetical protein